MSSFGDDAIAHGRLDKRFALVDATGELYFPVRSHSGNDYVVVQDAQGTSQHVRHLEGFIRAVVFEGRRVRVAADLPNLDPRALSLRTMRQVRGYVIDPSLRGLVEDAAVRPLGEPSEYVKKVDSGRARMAVFGRLQDGGELLPGGSLVRNSYWKRAKAYLSQHVGQEESFYLLLNDERQDGPCTMVTAVKGVQLRQGPSALLEVTAVKRLSSQVPLSLLSEWHTGRTVAERLPFADIPVVLTEELERFILDSEGAEPSTEVEDLVPEARAAYDEIATNPSNQHLSETETVRLANARIGQGRYRREMEGIWKGRCSVTSLHLKEVLVASHAKRWCDSSNAERLDPYNGLLLAASVDRLFEVGLISFDDDGTLRATDDLPDDQLAIVGLSRSSMLRFVDARHHPYLRDHRKRHGFEP